MKPVSCVPCVQPGRLCCALILLSIAACSGTTSVPDTGPAEPPVVEPVDPEPPAPPVVTQRQCERYDIVSDSRGASWPFTLPAAWEDGATLVVTRMANGIAGTVDSATGTGSYQRPDSRLPDRIEYELRAADGSLLSRYEYIWLPEPLRIMPLGDSITAGVEFFGDGVDAPAVPLRTGYRLPLYERLQAATAVFDFIGQGGQRAGEDAGLADPDNNGYPGVGADFIDSKLSEVLSDGDSDVLLLLIGSNDTPPDAAKITNILDRLDAWEQSNHAVLALVATLPPRRDGSLQSLVEQFNNDLRPLIAARSQDLVQLVELPLGVDDISLEDKGIHPTSAGYQKMAVSWFDALVAAEAIVDCP